ncbi:hypothetical protein [Burkholderia latens]|uniref:hypothetical protein n=1 Tax=Burkholderia latens TaxID=488446 RepID=UPI00158A011B|nr:hypothetical protein [Burkholderia latens]
MTEVSFESDSGDGAGMGSAVHAVANMQGGSTLESAIRSSDATSGSGVDDRKRSLSTDSAGSMGQTVESIDSSDASKLGDALDGSGGVTKWQLTKATLSGMGRSAAAQVAGHAVGIGLDLAVQTLLTGSEAALVAGTAMIPVAAGAAGAYLGYRYASSQFPADAVRGKLSAITTGVLAALSSYATLPGGTAAARAAGIAGAVNSVSSNWVMAELGSVLRKAGPRVALAHPAASEGGWSAYLAPWVGLAATTAGTVGATFAQSSRTVLGGIGAALQGAVCGGMAKAATATLANRFAATTKNPVSFKPHEATCTPPDHQAVILRGAWSTATVGASSFLAPRLKAVFNTLDSAPGAYNACAAAASAFASNIVSKVVWGWLDDASKVERPQSTNQADVEKAAAAQESA